MPDEPPFASPDPAAAGMGPVAYRPDQADPARAAAEAALFAVEGVRGVGEGRDALGEPAWIAYVVDRAVAARLPARLAGRAVIAEVTGEIDALPR
ncbi:MAG: hypothetical protein NZ523_13095 [Elioraea sp.]|nr:hypothetical protein [Elioraea sp.]MDW8444463.1 hypothetical protein [Acetobacteraceae bacterium]